MQVSIKYMLKVALNCSLVLRD